MIILAQSLTRGQKVQSRREREIKNSFLQFREKKEKPEIPFASFEREKRILKEYDSFSVEPTIWVRRGHESESGQMVLKKVKLTYFDTYLWQTMWNHAKKSLEESKHSDSVFLQWEVTDWQELFAKNVENKGN